MRKWKQLRKSGRCQPAYHVRSQFLNGEYIHAVPLQNVKERGRVGRTASGIHSEQAQPERRSRSCSARWSCRSSETSPLNRRQLPHQQ
jgi:hypothetical protein